METLPNISNFCVVKVLSQQTSLVSTKSGHLCILKMYQFKENVIIDDNFNRVFSEFKNLIAGHLLLQIDYHFAHQDTLYIVYEYCEGGSMRELLQRITLYNDRLYESELILWFAQMISSVGELNFNNILKFCDTNLIDAQCFLFKNNYIKFDTSKILLNFLFSRFPLMSITPKNISSSSSGKSTSLNLPAMSMREESIDKKLLFSIACIVYELATHKKINLKNMNSSDDKQIVEYASELPLPMQELWIRLIKFELTFPDIMDNKLVKDALSEESGSVQIDDPLVFNVESMKRAECSFGGLELQSSFDFESTGLDDQDVAELLKDL